MTGCERPVPIWRSTLREKPARALTRLAEEAVSRKRDLASGGRLFHRRGGGFFAARTFERRRVPEFNTHGSARQHRGITGRRLGQHLSPRDPRNQ